MQIVTVLLFQLPMGLFSDGHFTGYRPEFGSRVRFQCRGKVFLIYLTHFFALWIASEKLSQFPLAVKVATYSLRTAALSYILYHAVEHPMTELEKRTASLYSTKTESACTGAYPKRLFLRLL